MDYLCAIQTYVRIVNAGSFTVAAAELGLSRAVVTKQIMQLEKHLGARLLNRTTRQVSVTDIGKEYYSFSISLLRDLKQQEEVIGELQNAPCGTLRVLSPKSFGSLHMTDAVLAFVRNYPEIRVALILSDLAAQSIEVIERGFDLAIHVSTQRNSGLGARRVGAARWVTCAAPAYLDAHGTPLTPHDLTKHNCLIYSRSPREEWYFRRGKNPQKIKISGTFTSNSAVVLRRAVLDGIGLVQLPTYSIGKDLKKGRLRQVLSTYPLPQESIRVIFPHRKLMPTKSRLFIDFLANRFRDPPWD